MGRILAVAERTQPDSSATSTPSPIAGMEVEFTHGSKPVTLRATVPVINLDTSGAIGAAYIVDLDDSDAVYGRAALVGHVAGQWDSLKTFEGYLPPGSGQARRFGLAIGASAGTILAQGGSAPEQAPMRLTAVEEDFA